MTEMADLQAAIHANAIDHGWWDDSTRTFMSTMMLVVSEIAEAVEVDAEKLESLEKATHEALELVAKALS